MKKVLFIIAMLATTPALALNVEKSIKEIKEDLSVLQRQMYQGNSKNEAINDGTLEEDFRKLVGKVDTLEHKIDNLNSKIDMINKDIDIRISLIENKPIKQAAAPVAHKKEKFVAKVADKAPKTITGDDINSNELKPIVSSDVKVIYKEGMDAINAKSYDLAEQKFNYILTNFSKDKLAGNAQYWIGEVYYAKKDYKNSALAFAKGYQNYKNGNKSADSLLKLGMSMKELSKKEEACAAFTSMKTEFPKAEKRVLDKASSEAKNLECK
ncbi:MAG: tol-pal system protein YbgF [Alphaproteobacteria bacterium]